MALLARARRDLLLRAHRHRLRSEDLEDCYSQATLELVAQALNGVRYSTRLHMQHVLEQRFMSRIQDRRRALAGRSPMHAALEAAMSIGSVEDTQIEAADARAETEQLVILRQELRRVEELARRLSFDQRLVLACQLAGMSRAEFCRRFGWSEEKYRKVAQRGRARLRRLLEAEERGVPPAGAPSEQGRGTHL
jgi:DNA-directed RNA polymerase specialized sigma24 family protein